MNFDFNKIIKDVQESAKEFASTGLQLGSNALDAAAKQLKTIEAELRKSAEKLAPKSENGKSETTEGGKQ